VQEVAVQTCIVDCRTERVPFYRKKLALRYRKDVEFDREKTLFAGWKDNNRLLVDHDYQKWKLTRFVKKQADRSEVVRFFDAN
jgi:hypothetical protein